jgi:hypothetical protein
MPVGYNPRLTSTSSYARRTDGLTGNPVLLLLKPSRFLRLPTGSRKLVPVLKTVSRENTMMALENALDEG